MLLLQAQPTSVTVQLDLDSDTCNAIKVIWLLKDSTSIASMKDLFPTCTGSEIHKQCSINADISIVIQLVSTKAKYCKKLYSQTS